MQFRRRLGWLIAALLALPLLAVVLALGAAGLALETAPRLAGREAVTAEALDRARQLLRSHHPRRQRPGVMRVMVAEERDLQLLLSHGAARFPDAATALALRTGQAELSLSLPLASPWVPPAVVRLLGPRRWINLEVALRQGQGLPEVERWRIGRLPMPAWALPLVARQVLSRAGISVEEAWTADLVRQVDFRDRRLVVFYAWQPDTVARVLQSLTPPAHQARLRAYQERLASLRPPSTAGQGVSMPTLLGPLFELARQRSGGDPDVAAQEHRALLLTLALYANRRGLQALVPAAREWPRPASATVTLAGRTDLPLHFLISAVLAAESGSPLADAIGLHKEVVDAREGSGFSFTDLAADRAGTRFGERAVRDPLALQAALAALGESLSESALLPEVSDLPEFLSQAEFAQRFGTPQAPRFIALVREIESRLDTLPLLRPPRSPGS